VLAEVDVLVMTPDVLLHTISRGVFQVNFLLKACQHRTPEDTLQPTGHCLQCNDRSVWTGQSSSPCSTIEHVLQAAARNINCQRNVVILVSEVEEECRHTCE
jgi:hypothetical protein